MRLRACRTLAHFAREGIREAITRDLVTGVSGGCDGRLTERSNVPIRTSRTCDILPTRLSEPEQRRQVNRAK